jgi:SOS-response transcriptional repressor LexA
MKTAGEITRQKLTEKQHAIYSFIKQEITEQRLSPTVREIADQFGIRSSNGVMCHLRALERKGWIKRDYYLSRGITLVAEPVTQLLTLTPGEAGCLGEIYVGCVGVKDRSVTLEFIAPDTMGEVHKDL